MPLGSFVNLVRLKLLFLIFAILYPVLRKKSVYLFLNFSGPSFIKLGQSLSARPDLVGESLAKALSGFQDNVKPFKAKIVKRIIAKEFGENFDKIFSDFEYNATASASIAQVHKAILKDGEEKVAVKILRPNIKRIVRRDIKTLDLMIKIMSLFSKKLAHGFGDVSSLLKICYESELNLAREATNAVMLRKNMASTKGFYVPKVYLEHTNSKILVIEWIDGIAFCDRDAILNSKQDKKKIAKNLIISYFNQAYRDGFFHADMHQGNLFLMENGDIAAVDFGIMGQIDKKLRIAIVEILIAYLNKDYAKVAKIHIEAGIIPKDVNLHDLELTCRKIGRRTVGSSIKDISIAGLLGDLVEMSSKYQMSTRPELLLLQKTILLVEGVGVMLDPDLNIWNIAKPWVKDWAVKNISFDAKIRDAVVDFFAAVKNIVKSNL